MFPGRRKHIQNVFFFFFVWSNFFQNGWSCIFIVFYLHFGLIERFVHMISYLFGIGINRCGVTVTLTIDSRVSTSADCIHFPGREIVVHHVDITVPTPWHPLNKPLPEMVECNCHLHPRVRCVPLVQWS